MSIGANISVIAIGAILSFATHFHTPGFDVPAIGAILIVVGAVGLAMQLASLARQRELTATNLTQQRAVVVRPNDVVRGDTVADDTNQAWDQDGGY